MAIIDFQKPDKVIMNSSDDYFGSFEFRPLEPGYGITVGNALRRVLLNSLQGFAITSVKIEGVDHEFSAIKGVVEDVSQIILRLKQIHIKQQIEDIDNEKLIITISAQEQITAGDIGKFTSAFQVLNTDMVIWNMEKSVKIQMELTINKGRGYKPSEENKPADADLGTIAIDSIHTPIRNVKYHIENYRVGQKTDYEKLIIDIATDGSIHPKDALKEAAKVLIYHFMLFSDERITLDSPDSSSVEEFD